jgi:hypothetical protein
MPAPFAALETRINTACRDRLANAEAIIGSATVSGIFGQVYAESMGGMAAGRDLSFQALESDVGAICVGSTLSISGISYRVASHEPDGAGWLTLILQRNLA